MLNAVKSRLSRPLRGFSSGKKLFHLPAPRLLPVPQAGRQAGKILSLVFALFIFNSSFLIPNCMCQWVQMSNGMGDRYVHSIVASGNTIFAATYDPYDSSRGVYLSTNNGTTWTHTSLNQGVYSLVISGNNIFAGTYSSGVYLSTDNGTSWTQTSLNNQDIWSLTVNGSKIFAGSVEGGVRMGVYSSTNNGTSWTQTSLNNQNIYSLAVNGNNIFAGIQSYGLYLSTDNGTTWAQTSLNYPSVSSLAISGNNIFAGTSHFNSTTHYGIYLSMNNGTTWSQTSLNNHDIFSLAVNGNNVFAGGNSFYVSNDNGASWTQRNEGLINTAVEELLILNNYIFAGTWGNGVWRRDLSELTGIHPISEQVPARFSLSQNYPNPFNPETKIKFSVPLNKGGNRGLSIQLKIYDILGKEVAILVNQQLQPATYEVEWNATNYPSGIYFYKLSAGDFVETKKMILVK
jgi:Secretion system C-terminal sorting domain